MTMSARLVIRSTSAASWATGSGLSKLDPPLSAGSAQHACSTPRLYVEHRPDLAPKDHHQDDHRDGDRHNDQPALHSSWFGFGCGAVETPWGAPCWQAA